MKNLLLLLFCVVILVSCSYKSPVTKNYYVYIYNYDGGTVTMTTTATVPTTKTTSVQTNPTLDMTPF